jgi:uncharacterized small protein (TIGR04563 family)
VRGFDNCKQSLYLTKEMLMEMRLEAERLDRSLSWLVHTAWKLSKDKIQSMPAQGVT